MIGEIDELIPKDPAKQIAEMQKRYAALQTEVAALRREMRDLTARALGKLDHVQADEILKSITK